MLSREGTLVYSDVPSNRWQFAWADRSGNRLSTVGEPQRQDGAALSPDGRRLAVAGNGGERGLWVYELERGIRTRFEADAVVDSRITWTPSGNEITYAASRGGSFDIYSRSLSGNGEAIVLAGTPLAELTPEWSLDGKILIYTVVSGGRGQLVYRERQKDGSLGEPTAYLRTSSGDIRPRFSPDGKYVAYVSDESGQNEVYVRDFPKAEKKWQISQKGGSLPRWRRDGKELFYAGQGGLMAVPITSRPQFSPGVPSLLFARSVLAPSYDVSSDGKRFIVLDRPAGEPPLSIHVVHNWFSEFRDKQRPN